MSDPKPGGGAHQAPCLWIEGPDMPVIALPQPSQLYLALVACGLGLIGPAYAADEAQDTRLDSVTVISTGVRGAQRTVAESPAPIDVVTGEQLLKTGRADLTEAISKLLPSFNYGTNVAGYNSTIRPCPTAAWPRPTPWCWSTAN